MSEHADQSERTEEPTSKRLADARKRGDAPKSQEVTATALLAAGALGLWLISDYTASSIAKISIAFIDHPDAFAVDGASLHRLFVSIAISLGGALAGVGLITVLAAILGNIAQSLPVFTTHRMKPDLKKLSPLAGLKRIFGPAGLVNFAKGLGKLIIIGGIMVFPLWPERHMIIGLLHTEDLSVMMQARGLILKLLGLTVLAMIVISGLDFAFVVRSWKKRLRMTKEEVRREQKELDGDPQIKAQQKQLREAQSRRRMAEAVKGASVLIMNPTHYAVALKYESGVDSAPICTGKGMDELALRMRQIARDHQVPVVENPPLARALHASADLDREIPLEHYEAVAKVIGFVMMKANTKRP